MTSLDTIIQKWSFIICQSKNNHEPTRWRHLKIIFS